MTPRELSPGPNSCQEAERRALGAATGARGRPGVDPPPLGRSAAPQRAGTRSERSVGRLDAEDRATAVSRGGAAVAVLTANEPATTVAASGGSHARIGRRRARRAGCVAGRESCRRAARHRIAQGGAGPRPRRPLPLERTTSLSILCRRRCSGATRGTRTRLVERLPTSSPACGPWARWTWRRRGSRCGAWDGRVRRGPRIRRRPVRGGFGGREAVGD